MVVVREPSFIEIDNLQTSPQAVITGDVGGPAIQWIRANSHRYLGKIDTSDGSMAICQLDDSDSGLYHDGSEAVLTGSEGDVFMKLPRFFYHSEPLSDYKWRVGFSIDILQSLKRKDSWMRTRDALPQRRVLLPLSNS